MHIAPHGIERLLRAHSQVSFKKSIFIINILTVKHFKSILQRFQKEIHKFDYIVNNRGTL